MRSTGAASGPTGAEHARSTLDQLSPPLHGIGKAKAVTATARNIAVLFCNAVRYVDPGADHCEQRYKERVIKQLHRRAPGRALFEL